MKCNGDTTRILTVFLGCLDGEKSTMDKMSGASSD